jgi:membrane-associated phospholipid phosphatase
MPLAHLYPAGALTFWALAMITALLRYLLDAHWPSDVVGGVAVGYVSGAVVLRALGL